MVLYCRNDTRRNASNPARIRTTWAIETTMSSSNYKTYWKVIVNWWMSLNWSRLMFVIYLQRTESSSRKTTTWKIYQKDLYTGTEDDTLEEIGGVMLPNARLKSWEYGYRSRCECREILLCGGSSLEEWNPHILFLGQREKRGETPSVERLVGFSFVCIRCVKQNESRLRQTGFLLQRR